MIAKWMLDDLEYFFREPRNKGKVSNYPPTNIGYYTEDDKTYLFFELALAGFKKNEIEVVVEGQQLIVNVKKTEEQPTVEYLLKGISLRSVYRTFTLHKNTEVLLDSATFVDGILRIEAVLDVNKNRKVLELK